MKQIFTYFSISVLFLFYNGNSFAQSNISLPIIKNYSKDIYQAGLQNWEIQQDNVGRLYFANNDGLLTFDGANWQIIQVDNKTIVRSLLIDGERIYTGSQGDFGYFEPDSQGNLQYFSLKNLIEEKHQNFADVWDIVKKGNQIIFRTSNSVFRYDGNIHVLDMDKTYAFLSQNNQTTYLQNDQNGLSFISNNQSQPVSNTTELKDKVITSIIQLNESQVLITTLKGGIFKFDGTNLILWELEDDGIIRQNRINCSVKIDEERIAIGTLSGGLFIINTSGKVLQHIDIQQGLQSNDVLDIFKDGAGNLWLALGNGIDYVEISSPFSMIEPDGDLHGTGYSAKIYQDKVYFGTSNGLYVSDWKDYYNPFESQHFQLVNNTKGQVWGLDIHNNELILGHHEGTFRIEDNQAIMLSNLPGTWTSIALQNTDNQLLEGNYSGLNLYDFENGHWKFQSTIGNMIKESCRIMAQDDKGNIWVAHPYRGVYKIVLDLKNRRVESIRLYNSKNGFPSDLYTNVFKIGDGVIFTAERGIYTYNIEKDAFELSSKWSELVDSTSRVQRFIEDKKGNIWFVIDGEVGVFWVKDFGVEKRLEKQVFPQLKDRLVSGFEQIYPYDDENVFFPLERGFIHFNPTKYGLSDTLFHAHLQQIKLGDSTIIFGGWKSENWEKPIFKRFQNSFTFTYAASDFSDFYDTEFQYLLDGLDADWSPWTTKTLKEYTNLPAGKYIFKLRAKNATGQETETQTFEFQILPPWYASATAKVIYFLIILAILFGLIFIPRQKHEQEKAILKEEQEKTLQEKAAEHQKIVAQNEAEISQLQQEKLKAEIQFKNQELATTTMHLVQKGEFLNKLKEELNRILNETNEPKTKKHIRKTIKLLNENAQLDNDWEHFAQYFDQVHENFLKRLRDAYPQLTPKDQRLCTYLKMNLSTKEIAPLLNISVRGVEVSRYRLRKKMELPTETNLNEFMMVF
ncbi:MAG: ligand-binding sensor domain-containing protein/DNA-binding CsgD family transcriptional regulator [Cognaticolwellia sp.]|jgi:ligand-binding sensor domain-containing protein/DNA-binding CsgD family transcriptional regulator